MPYFTYDTSVFIARKLTDFKKMPRHFLMSAIVLLELIAGADNSSLRDFYALAFRRYHKHNLLIVPNDEDWLLAAKILYLLTQARKRTQRGTLQRLSPGASQRLALDVLIAVSARRWKAHVVTENWADFKAIQRYCNTTIVKAVNFFSR